MTYKEEFEQLVEDSDIIIVSGNVGTKINDSEFSFCLGSEHKIIYPKFYMISKLNPSTYLLTNKDEKAKNIRWVVNFYKEMWYGTNNREIIK